MVLPETDAGVYVVSGIFTIAVFAAAIVAVVVWGIDVSTGTVLMLSVGFFGFMAVYFVSLAVYRGIERREQAD
jgi:hypothetical protein